MRQRFKEHRADYMRFADALRKDPFVRWVDGDGSASLDGFHSRPVREYRELAHANSIHVVFVEDDGSIKFTLAGFGGAFIADPYMGVLFVPRKGHIPPELGWLQTVVPSLESKNCRKKTAWSPPDFM